MKPEHDANLIDTSFTSHHDWRRTRGDRVYPEGADFLRARQAFDPTGMFDNVVSDALKAR